MTSTEYATTPAPTAGPSWTAPARPRLARSRTEKMIGGVSGGLAAHTGIDPVLWRLLFLTLTVVGAGTGVLLYGLLWVLMPAADAPVRRPPTTPGTDAATASVSVVRPRPGASWSPTARQTTRWDSTRFRVGSGGSRIPPAAVAGQARAMTSALPPYAPPPAAEPPGTQPPPSSWPPPPPAGPAPRGQLRRSRDDKVLGGVAGGLAEYTGIDALLWRVGAIALTVVAGSGVVVYALLWLLMPSAPAGPPAAAVEKEPRGPRSPVPGVTLAVLLIVLGVVALVDQLTDADLGPRGYLGSALLVVGAGLVVGAVTGVGRGAKTGLIAVGVLLTAALALSSTVHLPSGDVGDRTYRPLTATAVQPRYEVGLGDLTVDLSDVDLTGLSGPIAVTIEAGAGDVDVLVPASADVQVTVDNGIGEAELFDQDGVDRGFFPGTGPAAWTGDDDPEFVLTISSGLGDVEVSRG